MSSDNIAGTTTTTTTTLDDDDASLVLHRAGGSALDCAAKSSSARIAGGGGGGGGGGGQPPRREHRPTSYTCPSPRSQSFRCFSCERRRCVLHLILTQGPRPAPALLCPGRQNPGLAPSRLRECCRRGKPPRASRWACKSNTNRTRSMALLWSLFTYVNMKYGGTVGRETDRGGGVHGVLQESLRAARSVEDRPSGTCMYVAQGERDFPANGVNSGAG